MDYDILTVPNRRAPAVPIDAEARVLHVINGLFYGGGQRVVLDLLKSLPRVTDVESRLCVLGESSESPLVQYCDLSLPYNGRYNNPHILLRTAGQLRRVIRRTGVDLLHTHGVDADLIGGLAVQGRRTRHICHLHITPSTDRKESWKARTRRKMLQWLTRRAGTSFIAVSEAVREQMARYYGLPPDRIVTVRNGVERADFTESQEIAETGSSRGIVFGTAARLAPMKGLEYLIQAARRLHEKRLWFELRIAGTGSQRKPLEALAERLKVSDRVRFLGHVSDMAAFYRQLDAFVLPSVSTEGLPLVVLEAMAAGRPIVATRLAGTPEAVREGLDGLLVPAADSIALSEAMAQVATDPELRQRMGRNGRERIEAEFTVEHAARGVAGVYRRVLGTTASGSGVPR